MKCNRLTIRISANISIYRFMVILYISNIIFITWKPKLPKKFYNHWHSGKNADILTSTANEPIVPS